MIALGAQKKDDAKRGGDFRIIRNPRKITGRKSSFSLPPEEGGGGKKEAGAEKFITGKGGSAPPSERRKRNYC